MTYYTVYLIYTLDTFYYNYKYTKNLKNRIFKIA